MIHGIRLDRDLRPPLTISGGLEFIAGSVLLSPVEPNGLQVLSTIQLYEISNLGVCALQDARTHQCWHLVLSFTAKDGLRLLLPVFPALGSFLCSSDAAFP